MILWATACIWFGATLLLAGVARHGWRAYVALAAIPPLLLVGGLAGWSSMAADPWAPLRHPASPLAVLLLLAWLLAVPAGAMLALGSRWRRARAAGTPGMRRDQALELPHVDVDPDHHPAAWR